jgi:uncharacterized cofD-like protein
VTAPRRAVAIGGGTGLPLVLSCLVAHGCETSAVVTVADDGGSSGRLRRELEILPPGDIRNCLVALAEPGNTLAQVFQYRFSSGEGLAGHALGNLILAALTDMHGDFALAIDAAAVMLGARGRVLPSTLADIVLSAEDCAGEKVTGQANVARSAVPLRRVQVDPPLPPAYPPVLEAIAEADLVVIGPGSLYTSIIPNLLIDGVAETLRTTRARLIYVCNVANQRGETTDMNALDHVRALIEHGLSGAITDVLVHDTDITPLPPGVSAVEAGAATREGIRVLGITVHATDLVHLSNPMHHDPALLCAALRRFA